MTKTTGVGIILTESLVAWLEVGALGSNVLRARRIGHDDELIGVIELTTEAGGISGLGVAGGASEGEVIAPRGVVKESQALVGLRLSVVVRDTLPLAIGVRGIEAVVATTIRGGRSSGSSAAGGAGGSNGSNTDAETDHTLVSAGLWLSRWLSRSSCTGPGVDPGDDLAVNGGGDHVANAALLGLGVVLSVAHLLLVLVEVLVAVTMAALVGAGASRALRLLLRELALLAALLELAGGGISAVGGERAQLQRTTEDDTNLRAVSKGEVRSREEESARTSSS